eukprot:CAMPEP_0117474854 /NCGR_PEP_ID=MMETSP0784-20121206/9495_1 /TAXON_ID=39447 /ORGANISM="" /LENGTH=71 /DNA_ID=CAMNT_0005269085 /DNA_START=58 /DNA_END=273 /DNA_ORIENTATION=-
MWQPCVANPMAGKGDAMQAPLNFQISDHKCCHLSGVQMRCIVTDLRGHMVSAYGPSDGCLEGRIAPAPTAT